MEIAGSGGGAPRLLHNSLPTKENIVRPGRALLLRDYHPAHVEVIRRHSADRLFRPPAHGIGHVGNRGPDGSHEVLQIVSVGGAARAVDGLVAGVVIAVVVGCGHAVVGRVEGVRGIVPGADQQRLPPVVAVAVVVVAVLGLDVGVGLPRSAVRATDTTVSRRPKRDAKRTIPTRKAWDHLSRLQRLEPPGPARRAP